MVKSERDADTEVPTKVKNTDIDIMSTPMTIKDLEKRKDKALVRTDTDNLWTKIESLQWVLFVIFAIKNDRMVVI
jgi:hypothetical protein